MKKLTLFLAFAAILFSFGMVSGQTKYNTYNNARFGYSISYPANLVPKGESDNGDGQVFEAADKSAKLTVWGINNALNQTFKQIYDEDLSKGNSVIYRTMIGKSFYVISGKQGGKIFYQKTIKGKDNVYFTFVFEYPGNKRASYDKAAAQIGKSFK